jgi:hypothetical protein
MRKTIAIALAAALAGCDLTATAEADSVCVTENATTGQIPGALGGTTVTDFALPASLKAQYDLGAALPNLQKDGVTATLVAQSLSLTSPENADLSGVDRVSLTVSAPGKPDVVFTYAKPAGATGAKTILVATPDAPANLVDYLQNGRTITVGSPRFSGRLPSTSWTPALRTCAGTKIDVDYLKAAGL